MELPSFSFGRGNLPHNWFLRPAVNRTLFIIIWVRDRRMDV